jgi:hypothetical protein
MTTNHDVVARKLADYHRGGLPLDKLVDWAEKSMMDGDFGEEETESLVEVVSRLGLADVRAFGLTWEDCRQMFKSLGLSAKLDLVAA